MISDLRNALPALMQNYGGSQDMLNRKLSYHLLCREENVTALNGASQVYPLLERFFEGRQVLIPSPTFGEYHRAFPLANTYFDEVGIDCNEIVEKSRPCDGVMFVNPNNPTGTTLHSEWIYEFAAASPGKIVLVDESFIDFSNQLSLVSLLEQNPLPNIIVIKSLSKTLGVPGIRLGYTYSYNQDFNIFLRNNIPIWNLNSIAEHFLGVILKHREAIAQSFQQTAQDRAQFTEMLTGLKHFSGINKP